MPTAFVVRERVPSFRFEFLAAGHEDVLVAVVVERFAGESAIESFQPQARDVEESQPFVLGCPPERTGSTTVQGDVDPVIADAVVDRVRQRCVGVLAVYGGCDLMVEGERVPGEATVRPKRCGDRLKAAATIGPSLRLVTGALRSRLLRQRAGAWSGLTLLRRCLRRRESARLRRESSSTYASGSLPRCGSPSYLGTMCQCTCGSAFPVAREIQLPRPERVVERLRCAHDFAEMLTLHVRR